MDEEGQTETSTTQRRSSRARRTRRDWNELIQEENDSEDGNLNNDDDEDEDASSVESGAPKISNEGRGEENGGDKDSNHPDEPNEDDTQDSSSGQPMKRKRGRPKGSKNKVRRLSNQMARKKQVPKEPELTEEERRAKLEKMKALVPSGMMMAAKESSVRTPSVAEIPKKPVAPSAASAPSRPIAAIPDNLKNLVKKRLEKSPKPESKLGPVDAVKALVRQKLEKGRSTSPFPIGEEVGTPLSKRPVKRPRASSPHSSASSSGNGGVPMGVDLNKLRAEAEAMASSMAKGSEGSVGGDSVKKQKRPKIRKTSIKPSVESLFRESPDLTPPANMLTSWNASEVIKNFLFVGAGWDTHGRCLVNRPNDPPDLKAARRAWCDQHCMSFVLNMAGSSKQRELRNIKYVLPNTEFVRIDMNDLDTWDDDVMAAAFDKGAEFIEKAWRKHREAKMSQRVHPNFPVPSILVHCVAGVNRSPMCVVWWLCKYHGVHIRDAWDLVRLRRDAGAYWKNITLGGEAPPEGFEPNIKDYENASVRKYQHRYDNPGASNGDDKSHQHPQPQQEGDDLKSSKSPEDSVPGPTQVAESKDDEPVSASTDAAKNEKLSNEEKDKLTSDMELAQPEIRYPKALWFINAERILAKYFKRRVDINGVSKLMEPTQPLVVQSPAATSDVGDGSSSVGGRQSPLEQVVEQQVKPHVVQAEESKPQPRQPRLVRALPSDPPLTESVFTRML